MPRPHRSPAASKPIWLFRPAVPDEVALTGMRHRGMEKRAWRLKYAVGIAGRRAKSAAVRNSAGAKPDPARMAAYSGQWAACQAQHSPMLRRNSASVPE